MKTFFSILLFALSCTFTHAQITLVKDIAAGTDASNPISKCVYNGYIYFGAASGVSNTNRELWRSDGTDAGTTLVKDINPAANASGNPNGMIVFNNTLFFSANDGTNGTELWKSDGTAGGTVMLKDIVSGINSSQPAEFTLFNGALYFTVTNSGDNKKFALWKTDGTAGGTVVVKDINTITQVADIARLKVSGTKLYFWAITDAEGREPWVSDGTTAGTNLIKDIFTGSTGSPGPSVDYDYTPDGNGGVYFKTAGNTALTDRELWKSDGTNAGTVLVKDIYPGTNTSELDGSSKVLVGGILYFTAADPNLGKELWRSDGTTAGTFMVKDIYPGAFLSSEAFIIGVAGTTIYLQATTPTYLRELWKSDGTDAGTVLVKDIYPGVNSGTPGNNSATFAVGNSLLFQATTAAAGVELWKTDGTDLGTTLIQDLQAGATGTNPNSFILLGSTVLFNDNPTATAAELYKLDAALLPLKWLSFTATLNSNNQAALNWKVSDEININRYEAEWSTDAVHYSTIATVNYNMLARGSYATAHLQPVSVNNYYRIKQIDADGKYSYTNVQLIKLQGKDDISVYPSPAKNVITIATTVPVTKLQLVNINGQVVKTWLPNANQQYSLTGVAAGVYFLKLCGNIVLQTQKIIVQ
jgi:trimeric autotransporter adhesin